MFLRSLFPQTAVFKTVMFSLTRDAKLRDLLGEDIQQTGWQYIEGPVMEHVGKVGLSVCWLSSSWLNHTLFYRWTANSLLRVPKEARMSTWLPGEQETVDRHGSLAHLTLKKTARLFL